MNVPLLVLGGTGICVGGICLGILIAVKIIEDCLKRAGWA